MSRKFLQLWFSIVSTILVLWGAVFAIFGLGILPITDRSVLLPWESALYGAIMMGWGVTLLLVGGVAFRRGDAELMRILLYGLIIWLIVEGLFSAYLGVWFNVGVDVAVLGLFAFPLIRGARTPT